MITSESGGARRGSKPPGLGRYELLGVLGEGGHGIVYEARDRETEATVALKVLHDVRPSALFRIKQEFRQLARLSHPNIVALLELDAHEGQVYFTMELVRGVDITSWLCGDAPSCRDRGRLDAALVQLVDAVEAIHAAGLVHRDLKPSNVVVASDGRVVLLDFGIAVARGAGPSDRFVGTPLYASPEQAAGDAADPATDWYSVGVMLHQWVAGRAPWRELDHVALLAAKRAAPPALDGTEPLAALVRGLLHPDAGARARGVDIRRAIEAPAPERSAPDWAPPEARPFFGRSAELAALEAAFAASRRGPVVAVIRGPAGLGKTALVERFLGRMPDDAVRLAGSCSELESLPYRAVDPIFDALALHLRALPRGTGCPGASSLARLFPVLREVPGLDDAARDAGDPVADPVADPVEARRRAFAEAGALLAWVAASHPTVVAIDDLQLADRDSLALVDAVFDRPGPPAVLVVCAVRTDCEVPPALAALFTALAGRGIAVREVVLGPLAAADGAALAASLLAAEASALAGDIVREAAGSPLFVRELAHHARGGGASTAAPRFDELVRARFEALAADDRAVIRRIAVAGGRLARDVSFARSNADRDAAVVLRRLCADGWLQTSGVRRTSELEIPHARIRDALLAHLPAPARAALHRTLAELLDDTGRAPAAQLAHHYLHGDDARALPHTLRAAGEAAAAFAFARTVEWYRRALASPHLPAAQRPEVEQQFARALANAGEPVASAGAFLRAAATLGDGPAAIELRCLAAEQLLYSGHVDEGRALLEQALRALGHSTPRSTPGAIAAYVAARIRVPSIDRAPPGGGELAPRARAELVACWTAARGLMIADLGLFGAVFHARYVRLALRSGDPFHVARALAHEAAVIATVQADRPRALHVLGRAREAARRCGDELAAAFADQCEGAVHYCFGDYGAASAAYERSVVAMSERCSGAGIERILSALNALIVLEHRGKLRALAPRRAALLREALDHEIPYVEGFARGIGAVAVALAGDRVDEARDELQRYLAGPARSSAVLAAHHAGAESSLHWYTGDAVTGHRLAEQRWRTIRHTNLMRVPWARDRIGYWRIANAIAAAGGGDRTARLGFARAGAGRLLRSQLPLGRAFGRAARAAIHLARGELEPAAGELRAALATFDELGLAGHAAAARRSLAALVGGSEGVALAAASDAHWRAEQVVAPERFSAMLLPGL